MKRFLCLCLLIFGLLSAGCQTTDYRWANSDLGFPTDCGRTLAWKSMEIQYCMVPEATSDDYYVEAVARSRGAHDLGRILDGSYEVILVKDDQIVYKGRMSRQGDDLGRAVYLRKSFHFEGDYDVVSFTWNIRYR